MAYASLVSLAKTIELTLNYHQDYIPPHVKNQIILINEYIIFLQAFFEEFPDRANSLERRISELTQVAEDTIEFLLSDALVKPHVGSSRSRFKQLASDLHELKEASEKIESMAEQVMEIKNRIAARDVRPGDGAAARSSALVLQDTMIGFDSNLMEILSRLCGESCKLEVIPITGMGGIGKTTLARNACDDPLIVDRFDIRAWVTVSQEYSVREIVLALLVSMKVLDAGDESMNRDRVYQHLKGRRYLVVLDDVWNVRAWDELRRMFPDDDNGSRIMLTTRLSDVACYADSCSLVHEMRLMDEIQSWNLLRQKVFKTEDRCSVGLEYVGKMIARSCRGLPLAIVVISGLLAVDQTEASWWNIAENIVQTAVSANDEQLDKILSLSYAHLPHHLRPCFLYMAGFPEDYEMDVSKLFKLWVAEGFLKPNEHKSLEEAAEEYLEDLVNRNLVLINKRRSNGRIKSLNIHDVMREMCIRKAKEENFFLHVHGSLPEGSIIPRRVSVSYSDLSVLESYDDPTTFRTVLLLKRKKSTPCDLGQRCFRLVRTMDLSNAYEFFESLDSVPAQVFELFHLRYLAFDYPFSIPAAISNLQNLQTLIISPKTSTKFSPLSWLPMEIWKMPQLRHLIFYSRFLPFKEGAPFALENLQTLSGAINFICFEKILERIPNLKKLRLVYKRWESFHEVYSYEEGFQLHNLIHLQKLENLKLELDRYNLGYAPGKFNLCFPSTIKKLTLSGCLFPWKDMRIVGSLPNLEVLKLRDHACVGNTWETTEGDFSQLIFLLIDQSDLQHWITESSHFPKLKSLMLRRCLKLEKIPDDIGEIPTLELIEVDDLNKPLAHSAKQIQEDQRGSGNDALQVRVARDLRSKEFRVVLHVGGRFDNMETASVYVGGEVYVLKYSSSDDVSLEYLTRIGEREGSARVYAKNGDGFESVGSKSDLVRLCEESLSGDKKVRLYIEGNASAELVDFEPKDPNVLKGVRHCYDCCYKWLLIPCNCIRREGVQHKYRRVVD